jgi:predicted metal-dependent phosphoesterase TrpH
MELAQRGESFSVMAITDHDNCDGVEEFLAACAGLGCADGGRVRLAGIELSVEPGEGYDKFHLLDLALTLQTMV